MVLEFPRPTNAQEMTVQYPFTFRPVQDDSGPIDLGSPNQKYQAYLKGVRRSIGKTWLYPADAAKLGIQGTVRLMFTINKDGTPTDIKVVQSSNHIVLDNTTVDAIKKVGKFPPLPPELKKEKLQIASNFIYRLDSISNPTQNKANEMVAKPATGREQKAN